MTDKLLRLQLDDYEKLVVHMDSIDSLRLEQIKLCKDKIEADNIKITKLEQSNANLKKWSKVKNWIIGGLAAAVALVSTLSL